MTEANWPKISLWIKAAEGGFVNDPRDPGGATNFGITQSVLIAWRKKYVSVADVKALQWDEAAAIYKAQYFDPIHGCDLPSGLDYAVTDAAVNSGVVQAVKWLQAALKVKTDGHYGILTAHAVSFISQDDVKAIIDAFDKARLGFLRHLRTWPVFGKGWFARVNLVTSRAKSLVFSPLTSLLHP